MHGFLLPYGSYSAIIKAFFIERLHGEIFLSFYLKFIQ